jgi:hypothetical protein
MTAEQLRHLAQLLEEFIFWVDDTEDPPLDLAPFRWTLYMVRVSAKVMEDVQP